MKTRIYTTPGGDVPALFCNVLKQNHVLIAGCTGSGKSVVINGLIYTLLHRLPGTAAGRAQMILVDPKRVELAQYARVPHTIAHAAGQNPEAWLSALRLACDTMDRRYDDMESRRLREYDGGDLYVIIDEWASINSKFNPLRGACCAALLRLVSEGRAARVHVILATQVPKATIIPSEIRDQFAARIALMTENRLQSRTIIDAPGCEEFPSPKTAGYAIGMYCLPGNDRKLWYMPYIQEDELDRIVLHWEQQVRPEKRGLLRRIFC